MNVNDGSLFRNDEYYVSVSSYTWEYYLDNKCIQAYNVTRENAMRKDAIMQPTQPVCEDARH